LIDGDTILSDMPRRTDRVQEECNMTTFTVWKFDDPEGAGEASSILKHAASDHLVTIVDHAVVSWPVGQAQPTTSHGHDATRRGTGWGAFWGVLLGSIFLMPVAGAVAGAAIGAYNKATQGVGISKEQIESIRTEVTEGTSALFVVTEKGDVDRLGERFNGMHSKLIASNLTADERRILLETFGT
jgi:uncharacterized membrane protein